MPVDFNSTVGSPSRATTKRASLAAPPHTNSPASAMAAQPMAVDDIAFISSRLLAEALRRREEWGRRQGEEQAWFEYNLEAQRLAYQPAPEEVDHSAAHKGRAPSSSSGLRYPTHPHEFSTSMVPPPLTTIPLAEDESVQLDIDTARAALQNPSKSQRGAMERHWRQLEGRDPIKAAKRMAAQLLAIVEEREGASTKGIEQVTVGEAHETRDATLNTAPSNRVEVDEGTHPRTATQSQPSQRPTHSFLSNFGPLRRRVAPLPSATEEAGGQYHNSFAPTMNTSTNADTPQQQYEAKAASKLMYQNSVVWEGMVVPSSLAAAMLYHGPMTRSERLLRVRPKLVKMQTRKDYYEDLKDREEGDGAVSSSSSDEERSERDGPRLRNPFPDVKPRYLQPRKKAATSNAQNANLATFKAKPAPAMSAQRVGRATVLAPLTVTPRAVEPTLLAAKTEKKNEAGSKRVNPKTHLRNDNQLAPIAASVVKVPTAVKVVKQEMTPNPSPLKAALPKEVSVATSEHPTDDTKSTAPPSSVTVGSAPRHSLPSSEPEQIGIVEAATAIEVVEEAQLGTHALGGGGEEATVPADEAGAAACDEDDDAGYGDEGFEALDSPKKQLSPQQQDEGGDYADEGFEDTTNQADNKATAEDGYEEDGFEEVLPSPTKASVPEASPMDNDQAAEYNDDYEDEGFDPPTPASRQGKRGVSSPAVEATGQDEYIDEAFESPDDIQNDIFGGGKDKKGRSVSSSSSEEGYSSDEVVEEVPLTVRKVTPPPQVIPQQVVSHRSSNSVSSTSGSYHGIPNPPAIPQAPPQQPIDAIAAVSHSLSSSGKNKISEHDSSIDEAEGLAVALKKAKEKKDKKGKQRSAEAVHPTTSDLGLPPKGKGRTSFESHRSPSQHSTTSPIPSRSPLVQEALPPPDLDALNRYRESLNTRSSLGAPNGRGHRGDQSSVGKGERGERTLNTSIGDSLENTPMVEGHEAAGRAPRRRGQRGSDGSGQQGRQRGDTPSASGFTSLSDWFSAK